MNSEYVKEHKTKALLSFAIPSIIAKLGMGIKGSATATLIVQIVLVVLQFVYFFGKGRNNRFCRFSFDRDVNRETLLNGSSEFIGEMASAISMFAFNFVLMKYVGTEGVAAFTVLGFAVYGYSMIAVGSCQCSLGGGRKENGS